MAKFSVETTRGEMNYVRPTFIVADLSKRGRSKFALDDKDAVDAMRQSILSGTTTENVARGGGLLEPVIVFKNSEGKPELVAGFTRWMACVDIEKHHNDEFRVSCVTIPVSDARAVREANIRENNDRNELSEIDHAYNQAALKADGYTQAAIATLYGWDQSRVSRCAKLLTLSDDLQRRVHLGENAKGGISVAAALKFLQLAPEQQTAFVVAKRPFTAPEVAEFKRECDKPAPPASNVIVVPAPRVEPMITSESLEVVSPPALDFSAVAPVAPKPKGKRRETTQRTLPQVKEMMSRYIGDDTHVVIKVVTTMFMAFIAGECDAEEVAQMIAEIEGSDYRKESPVKKK